MDGFKGKNMNFFENAGKYGFVVNIKRQILTYGLGVIKEVNLTEKMFLKKDFLFVICLMFDI